MSQNMEINNSVYTSSIDPSLFQSVTDQAQLNSIIKNMTTDTLDRPIKYSKPKYLQVEKTYKELAPITNKTIQMPTKQSNKIRTLDTVYQQPIVLGENASASVIFKGNEYEQNIPLPTNSVINNLIKDSVMQSNINQDYQDFQQIYNQDFQSNIQPPRIYNHKCNRIYNHKCNRIYNHKCNQIYNHKLNLILNQRCNRIFNHKCK